MVSASSNALSQPGFFDSFPSASIDFCEPNYYYTPYVAEVFNSVSSLSIAYLGVAGLIRTWKTQWCSDCKYERWCFYSMYTCALLIGLGSTALHATLTSLGQACDEIPMLLSNVSFFALMLEHKSEPNKLRYPWLPAAVPIVKVLSVVTYLVFQEQYFVFLLMYGGGAAFLIFWMAKLTFIKRDEPFEEKMRKEFLIPFFIYAFLTYVCFGFGAWVMDMIFCDRILASGFVSLQAVMHPLWHVGAMLGTHLALCLGAMLRCTALGAPIKIEYFMLLPFVTGGRRQRKRKKMK